jgi:hypothetical protein
MLSCRRSQRSAEHHSALHGPKIPECGAGLPLQVADFVGDAKSSAADARAVAERCRAAEWDTPAGEALQVALFDLASDLLRSVLRALLALDTLDSLLASLPPTLHKPLVAAYARDEADGLHLSVAVRAAGAPLCAGLANAPMAHSAKLWAQLPYMEAIREVDISRNSLGNVDLVAAMQVRAACRNVATCTHACVHALVRLHCCRVP